MTTLPPEDAPAFAWTPHDPADRVILLQRAGWQARVPPRNHPAFQERLRTGSPHLQLWHAASGVSVLLPCLATRFSYEVRDGAGETLRFGCYHGVQRYLASQLGLLLLPPQVVTDLYARFVLFSMVGAGPPLSPSAHGRGTLGARST